MDKVNHGGRIISKDTPVFTFENRSFRYGDGLFETMRFINGEIPFWNLHLKRLKKGAKYLQLKNIPKSTFIKKEILKLCGGKGAWRVRFSLYRKDGGLYTPQDSDSDFFIEAEKLTRPNFMLNKKGLKIDVFDTFAMPVHPIFKFKTSNSLPYVLAGIFKKELELEDCILINDRKEIVEASSSNIFIVRKNKILTPPLSSGCKDGVMRKTLLNLSKKYNWQIEEKLLQEKDLHKAKEVWLSNATQGLRWVANFKNYKYQKTKAKKIIAVLNDQALT